MTDTHKALVIGEGASPFRIAFAEWTRALAAQAALDVIDHEDDYAQATYKAVKAAEWELLKVPAGGIVEIRERALVVQQMFSVADWTSEPADNRHRLMLATLISEILGPDAEA